MKIIGITGGIGSGKSTVTQLLRKKGYHVVDADLIAREIVAPGSEVLGKLVEQFGPAIRLPDGSLNRQKLAELAFANPTQKEILDHLTHKAILDEISVRTNKIRDELNPSKVFIDAALLIETGLFKFVDEVWLVTAPAEQRVQRVIARDHMNANEVKRRMGLQMTDDQKAKYAFRTIDNSGTKKDLYESIEKILREYETV